MPRKPKPFKNPRIEVGSHGRTWQTISPMFLTSGDIVSGLGQVVSVLQDETPEIVVSFLNGVVKSYTEESDPVSVLVKKVRDE